MCLLLEAGGLKLCPLLSAPCSTQKGNPWRAVKNSGMCRGAGWCLLCAHVPWLVMLWWRHWRKPQESALRQICDVAKHHLHWRRERDVERLEKLLKIKNLLKVTLPGAGRAGARIQCWLWALCLHHRGAIYSRELQLKWEARDTAKVLDSWTDCKCSGQSCDYNPCELCLTAG